MEKMTENPGNSENTEDSRNLEDSENTEDSGNFNDPGNIEDQKKIENSAFPKKIQEISINSEKLPEKYTVGANYIKPAYGEKNLIYVLDIFPKIACWLPDIRKTLYMDEMPPTDAFKRVRFVVLLQVYDWNSSKTGIVELTETEYEEFCPVYEAYLKTGGELYYFREKRGRKVWHIFEVRPGEKKPGSSLKKSVLSERFSRSIAL